LEVTRDAQAWANNYFIQVDHPQWGPLTMPGFPWEFSETPASWRLPAPRLGEHTEEILAALGFAPDEITSLQKGKIIL
jgi:crotonobetainyl-CoA:carnitine CoA-transferase CaiB-like acyl-CoA transferase